MCRKVVVKYSRINPNVLLTVRRGRVGEDLIEAPEPKQLFKRRNESAADTFKSDTFKPTTNTATKADPKPEEVEEESEEEDEDDDEDETESSEEEE